MAAGLTTFGAGLFKPRLRALIAPTAYAGCATLVIVAGAASSGRAGVSSGNAGLAYIVAVGAGLAVLGLPRVTARFARELEPLPERTTGPQQAPFSVDKRIP